VVVVSIVFTASSLFTENRELFTSVANISGTDQAIDKRKTALLTTILSTLDENNFGELWSTNKRVYAANIYPAKTNRAHAL